MLKHSRVITRTLNVASKFFPVFPLTVVHKSFQWPCSATLECENQQFRRLLSAVLPTVRLHSLHSTNDSKTSFLQAFFANQNFRLSYLWTLFSLSKLYLAQLLKLPEKCAEIGEVSCASVNWKVDQGRETSLLVFLWKYDVASVNNAEFFSFCFWLSSRIYRWPNFWFESMWILCWLKLKPLWIIADRKIRRSNMPCA